MPSTVSEAPQVSMSFANSFWGKDDAGVSPLLERMHNAKVTGDELKSFYTARAAIEDEYARKLLNLARKPLGSSEGGTLRISLDVIRGEIESMGKSHQNVAHQMKTELDEQLAAFVGGMKERRKIVQIGIEKLLKSKTQQTMSVNKARDRYQQDCFKIKGYLAQGHMVMGQEERKNKAKLEKTQIQLSTTSNEYESAVKVLEETTGRWNRDWKAACDKFQDLEEERLDFMKSSLWNFANVSSTVCVSDDAACEKIRLSLEDCDVEKDITTFIKEYGTGQEIPDAPKYINFRREDISDTASDTGDEENYSVAQFQRTMNPAFRSSSPQPSTYESHHDPYPDSAHEQEQSEIAQQFNTSGSNTPRGGALPPPSMTLPVSAQANRVLDAAQREAYPQVPHNDYPMDGMTQFCRTGLVSTNSSVVSAARPVSRDSQSECSNPTSFTSPETSVLSQSPNKAYMMGSDLSENADPANEVQKKRSGFFQNRSPFRRKSKSEKDRPQMGSTQSGKRNTWAGSNQRTQELSSGNAAVMPPTYGQTTSRHKGRISPSPEPVDPRADFQLNVGNNIFDVASPDARRKPASNATETNDELDPIAQALAELKGVTKQASVRMSADRYHGLKSPAPGSVAGRSPNSRYENGNAPLVNGSSPLADRTRAVPPPSYEQPPVSYLGAPQPAFTSRKMQETTQKYVSQKQEVFDSRSRYGGVPEQQQHSQRTTPQSRPGTRGGSTGPGSRAVSPVPFRSTSPRPSLNEYQVSPNQQVQSYSSNSSQNTARPRSQSTSPIKPRQGSYNSYASSQGSQQIPRAISPQPQFRQDQRPRSSDMSLQLAPINSDITGSNAYGGLPSARGRPMSMQTPQQRPVSQYGVGNAAARSQDSRARSRSSAAEGRQFTPDGKPILQFSRAQYMYQAAIPEELSFAKGDVLAVLRLQDDGWWEAEVVGKRSGRGLVPSNYLVEA